MSTVYCIFSAIHRAVHICTGASCGYRHFQVSMKHSNVHMIELAHLNCEIPHPRKAPASSSLSFSEQEGSNHEQFSAVESGVDRRSSGAT